jgi:hypothetical protein
MIIAKGALQLVTGSPANGGIIIIPKQFKVQHWRRQRRYDVGCVKKLTSLMSCLPIILLLVILFKPLSVFFLFSTATGLTNL